ncbi:hypothetical protein DY000_02017276 [Brassica cretica]|uniref:No apical meristem-associated C-terminal domain-containing protein n=1 Tax=Brassica cretica TaxID=69181 RepID=A0ABQ7CPE5_BRACR|nr:hypothetical protein DY000_02017276 [Brassica cretica]
MESFETWKILKAFVDVQVKRSLLCDSLYKKKKNSVPVSASSCSIAKVESIILYLGTDTDGFVIPSLEIKQENVNDAEPDTSKPSSPQIKAEGNIYLGPHGGAPPSQLQDGNASSRKQRFKQKLKEADQKMNVSGRENKVANLRELVGGVEKGTNVSKDVSRDWLDPHCHESQFEKRQQL